MKGMFLYFHQAPIPENEKIKFTFGSAQVLQTSKNYLRRIAVLSGLLPHSQGGNEGNNGWLQTRVCTIEQPRSLKALI